MCSYSISQNLPESKYYFETLSLLLITSYKFFFFLILYLKISSLSLAKQRLYTKDSLFSILRQLNFANIQYF